MCGVAGIFDLEGKREADRDALRRMTDALRHRGPDGEGYFFAPGVGLGHRRLAIIDKAGGAQPFRTADGRGALSYNGEIYNYRDLSRALAAEGVRLSTRSDTEVLAEGLRHRGAAFVAELEGMFAFGYFDAAHDELILARDRFGEKPLYYATTPDRFLVFASEMSALVASGLLPLEFDDEALRDYFLYGFIPDPKTIYRGVRKTPPASTIIFAKGAAPHVETYWRPDFAPDASRTFEDACADLLPLLDKAVASQMIADVPLGAFLSGGVDSSAIVASMAKTGAKVAASFVDFDAGAASERDYARHVASAFGADLAEETARLDASDLVDEIARVYGEPFADPSALPTYLVSKLTRVRVTVALSGDGGDEVFAGYRRYPHFLREEEMRRRLPASIRAPVFQALGDTYPKLDWAPRPLRAKTTLQAWGESAYQGYARAVAANLPERTDRILSEGFKLKTRGYDSRGVIADAMKGAPDHPLLAAQQADLKVWLPGRVLTKVDRASMAHSLETRAPFLDRRLVEWVNALPADHKLAGGVGKRVLKQALEKRLPRDVLYRPKRGFAPPLKEWFRAHSGLSARLSDSVHWRRSGLFEETRVAAMIESHRGGRTDCSQELWTVLMFDAFLRARAV